MGMRMRSVFRLAAGLLMWLGALRAGATGWNAQETGTTVALHDVTAPPTTPRAERGRVATLGRSCTRPTVCTGRPKRPAPRQRSTGSHFWRPPAAR